MTLIISIIFLTGFCAIILEQLIKQKRAATALITAVLCWAIILIWGKSPGNTIAELETHTAEAAAVLFFLLPAMTIVELMESHGCFKFLSGHIKTKSPVLFLWLFSSSAFFLSAILDNLTASIIMIMIARKIIPEKAHRIVFSGAAIIAVNAGGAWSPIGDVTTVMLWISQRITAWNVMKTVFFPSIICLTIPLLFLSHSLKKSVIKISPYGPGPGQELNKDEGAASAAERMIILFSGLILLASVPFLKSFLNIPPYMGMLLALGVMWVITEFMNKDKMEDERYSRSVSYALKKIDFATLIFLLGILLSVSSLKTCGILDDLTAFINSLTGNKNTVAIILGLSSSVIDNVPLTAALIEMFPLQSIPVDNPFWMLVTYCTGVGGNLLIIGSAAGIAVMGMEKISFFTYLKKFGWLSIAGYISGLIIFFIQQLLFKLQ